MLDRLTLRIGFIFLFASGFVLSFNDMAAGRVWLVGGLVLGWLSAAVKEKP